MAIDCLIPFHNVCAADGSPLAGWFNETSNVATFVTSSGASYTGAVQACCCDSGGGTGGTATPNTSVSASLIGDSIAISVADSQGTLTSTQRLVSADACNGLEMRADGLYARQKQVAHPQWTYIAANDVCPVLSTDVLCVDPWQAKYDGVVTCLRVWLPVNESAGTAALSGNTGYEGSAQWRLETSTDNLIWSGVAASPVTLSGQSSSILMSVPITADTFLAPQLFNVGSPAPTAPILQATVVYDYCV